MNALSNGARGVKVPMTVRQIEKAILKLDAHSRAKLAEKLLHSLEELSEEENEELWAREALRRHQELSTGKSTGRSANDVLKDARALLK